MDVVEGCAIFIREKRLKCKQMTLIGIRVQNHKMSSIYYSNSRSSSAEEDVEDDSDS